MVQLRTRLTYANLMATIAVFIALGGASYAAIKIPHNSVGTAQLRTGAVTSAKVKDHSLRAADFNTRQLPAGRQGTTGPQGPQGTTGANGANGSPAFGAVLGRGVGVPMGTQFLAPSGQLKADPNENNVSSFTPNATMRASDLAVTLSVGTAPAESRTFTLRVGNADTALSCTVPPGNTGCTSTKSVTIPGGSLVSIGATSSGASGSTDVRFGWRATS